MANGRGRPVPAGRKLIAVPIGVIGVFVALFGAGMQSWQVSALGLALVVLAVGLVFVPALRGGSRIYVSGTGHVVNVSEPPASSVYGRCEMQLVVEAPGLPPAAVRVLDSRVPISKWPDPGATLPILVAVDDLRRVRVQWDDVLTHAEMADYVDEPEILDEDAPHPWAPRRDTIGDLVDSLSDDTDPGDGSWQPGDDEPIHPADREAVATYPADREAVPVMPLIHPADQEAAPVPGPRRPSPYPRGYDGAESATATAVLDDEEELAAEELAAAYPGARPDQGGTILGVGLTLLVADLDRSVAFYRDTLGFDEVDLGDGNAVLASGDTRLVLRTVQDVAPVNRRVMHINLEVGDVAAVYADLRERGVKFTYAPRVVNRGERLELWAAAFKDPDGHGVALTQWRRPEPPPERAPDQAPEPAPEPLREPRGRIAERLNPDAPPAE